VRSLSPVTWTHIRLRVLAGVAFAAFLFAQRRAPRAASLMSNRPIESLVTHASRVIHSPAPGGPFLVVGPLGRLRTTALVQLATAATAPGSRFLWVGTQGAAGSLSGVLPAPKVLEADWPTRDASWPLVDPLDLDRAVLAPWLLAAAGLPRTARRLLEEAIVRWQARRSQAGRRTHMASGTYWPDGGLVVAGHAEDLGARSGELVLVLLMAMTQAVAAPARPRVLVLDGWLDDPTHPYADVVSLALQVLAGETATRVLIATTAVDTWHRHAPLARLLALTVPVILEPTASMSLDAVPSRPVDPPGPLALIGGVSSQWAADRDWTWTVVTPLAPEAV
jgi:hypothetical protein